MAHNLATFRFNELHVPLESLTDERLAESITCVAFYVQRSPAWSAEEAKYTAELDALMAERHARTLARKDR